MKKFIKFEVESVNGSNVDSTHLFRGGSVNDQYNRTDYGVEDKHIDRLWRKFRGAVRRFASWFVLYIIFMAVAVTVALTIQSIFAFSQVDAMQNNRIIGWVFAIGWALLVNTDMKLENEK